MWDKLKKFFGQHWPDFVGDFLSDLFFYEVGKKGEKKSAGSAAGAAVRRFFKGELPVEAQVLVHNLLSSQARARYNEFILTQDDDQREDDLGTIWRACQNGIVYQETDDAAHTLVRSVGPAPELFKVTLNRIFAPHAKIRQTDEQIRAVLRCFHQASRAQRVFNKILRCLIKWRTSRPHLHAVTVSLITIGVAFFVVAGMYATYLIPKTLYRLALGTVPSMGNLAHLLGPFTSALLTLLILFPIGWMLFRMIGGKGARQRYFTVLFLAALFGLGSIALPQTINGTEHPRASMLLALSWIAIVFMELGVIVFKTNPPRLIRVIAGSTFILLLSILSTQSAGAWYARQAYLPHPLFAQRVVNPFTGETNECRPKVPGIGANGEKISEDVWPDVPTGFPRNAMTYLCADLLRPGNEPMLGFQGVAMSDVDRTKLLVWKQQHPERPRADNIPRANVCAEGEREMTIGVESWSPTVVVPLWYDINWAITDGNLPLSNRINDNRVIDELPRNDPQYHPPKDEYIERIAWKIGGTGVSPETVSHVCYILKKH